MAGAAPRSEVRRLSRGARVARAALIGVSIAFLGLLCPDRLEAAIADLPEASLDLSLSSQSWTIRQIIHHLSDGIDLWKGFIKQAIGHPGSEFSLIWYWGIPQDEWAKRWAYAERRVEPSLALYRACHAHIFQLLEQSTEAWENCLVLKLKNGEERSASVGWVVEMQTQHNIAHIEDIRKIRGAHRV